MGGVNGVVSDARNVAGGVVGAAFIDAANNKEDAKSGFSDATSAEGGVDGAVNPAATNGGEFGGARNGVVVVVRVSLG